MTSQNKAKNKLSLAMGLCAILPIIVTACSNGTSQSSITHQQYAYLINQGENNILIYSKDESGNLTPLVAQESIATGNAPKNGVIDNSSTHLYIPNGDESSIYIYSINPTNGTLTKIGAETTGTDPFQVEFDKSGRHIYITNYLSNTISIYDIDPDTGLLTPSNNSVNTVATNFTHGPTGIAFTASGKYAYVISYDGGLQMFNVTESGFLTKNSDVFESIPNNVQEIVITQNSSNTNFIYVTSSLANIRNTIYSYQINENDGSLSLVESVNLLPSDPTGQAFGLAIDLNNQYLYETNLESTINVFAIGNDGTLSQTGSIIYPQGVQLSRLTINPIDNYIYVNNTSSLLQFGLAPGGNLDTNPVAYNSEGMSTSTAILLTKY